MRLLIFQCRRVMTLRTTLSLVLAFVVVFTLVDGTVSAHHGRPGYGNKQKTLRGVITEVRWVNPHVFIMFDVKEESGDTVRWTGEFSSVTTMISEGMTKNMFKPGDEVVVSGTVAESGDPHSLVVKIQKADGSASLDLSERRGVYQ